jgi:RNA polymerase sigma-70 factor (ECF subfamily)
MRVELSDADLIARVALDDDHQAFAELVRRHQSAVRATLRSLARGNDVLADELAHETFLRAYRHLKSFRGESQLSTWLYRIAYNVYQAEVRRLKPHDPLDDHAAELTLPPQTDRVDFEQDLAAALQRLTENERTAIVLCYRAGLTHEEAAHVLGWPLGTLKTNILTAKDKLRSYLAAWADRKAS